MKKILWIFFVSLAFLFLSFSQILAADCPTTGDPSATGIVPCGVSCSCTISNFFVMLARIYKFLVTMIATPLAVIALTVGGIFIMISAGNPGLKNNGQHIVLMAIIGLALVFCSYLIIATVLNIIGYTGNWSSL